MPYAATQLNGRSGRRPLLVSRSDRSSTGDSRSPEQLPRWLARRARRRNIWTYIHRPRRRRRGARPLAIEMITPTRAELLARMDVVEEADVPLARRRRSRAARRMMRRRGRRRRRRRASAAAEPARALRGSRRGRQPWTRADDGRRTLSRRRQRSRDRPGADLAEHAGRRNASEDAEQDAAAERCASATHQPADAASAWRSSAIAPTGEAWTRRIAERQRPSCRRCGGHTRGSLPPRRRAAPTPIGEGGRPRPSMMRLAGVASLARQAFVVIGGRQARTWPVRRCCRPRPRRRNRRAGPISSAGNRAT